MFNPVMKLRNINELNIENVRHFCTSGGVYIS